MTPREETGFGLYKNGELFGVDLTEGLANAAKQQLESRRLLDGSRPDAGKFQVVPVRIVPIGRDGATIASAEPVNPRTDAGKQAAVAA